MIDYENIVKRRDYYDRKIFEMHANLERAKINNQEYERILSEKDEVESLLCEFEKYAQDLKRLISAVEREDREFKTRRLTYLSKLIEESLFDIFPLEDLQVRLQCDFNSKSEVTLHLLDSAENELSPDICSGKLQQYLISFAAVAGIARGLGINNLYVDEAFGVAAPAILGSIGEVVQKSVKQGMQIVMIAQNSELYKNLERREITLQTNPKTRSVEVVSEIDY